jgi:hypothetical protein
VRAAQHWATDDVPQVDCDDHAQRLAWLSIGRRGQRRGRPRADSEALPHQAVAPAMLDHVRRPGCARW